MPIPALERKRPRQSMGGAVGSLDEGTAQAMSPATAAATGPHEQKDAAPPEMAQWPPTDDWPRRDPDAGGGAPQPDGLRGLLALREDVRDQRQGRWKDPCGADAHQGARCDQLMGRPAKGAGKAAGREHPQPSEQDPLASDAVAEAPRRKAGLRVAEALALRPTDVDLDRATLRVLHGKGDKARTVPLEPGACAAVQLWLARRAELRIPRRAPLFCTLDGRKSPYPQQVRTTLQRLADQAGLEKRVHPHALRHAFAVHLDRQGVPVTTIQYVLGHASLSITTRYLAGLGQEEHLDRVRRVPW